MKTSGNTVLITGGGTGIGLSLARKLVESKNTVAICGRRRHVLLAAKRMIPELKIKVCDVSRPRSRQSLLKWIREQIPGINVLVNNAGIQRAVDLSRGVRDLSLAEAEVATNLLAPIHLSALLIPTLKKRKQAAIVNITSGLAFTPLAVVPVYCATKAGLHSLSCSLRHQLNATGIRVYEIAPPMVATELSGARRSSEDDARAMSAEAVAAGIVDALEHDVFEVALGAAENLRSRREELFTMLNS